MTSRSSLDQHEQSLLRTYVRSEVVVVYKTKEAFGGLSNMASGYPLHINGVRILTTEALYQACRFPHTPEVQRDIIGQHSPMTAKMKSKPHRKTTRPDWYEVRHKIMRWCLRVKLAQNYEEFGRLLLLTCDKSIVEQSRKDDFWGARLADEAGDTLVGQNVLGRLLMELREKLKEDAEGVLKTVPPLGIPDFLLLNKPIERVTANSSSDSQRPQSELF
ncbi:NADAR family protein [Marinomonas sp. C2222]|uniref:NADAR family protein n=1 Tax=Marinomonas sargassi TaxID=2984494 RepID=A0ABT2YQV7_9GAMM|nr:NADAR family protein [Marinomonas sargassi]MCV2402277.1 NADAR family protein [Marinomonas sargassi]